MPSLGKLAGLFESQALAQSRRKAHAALNNAIESIRRGEYEKAAEFLKEAAAGQDELSDREKQELASWSQLNVTALQTRQEGAGQLAQAEKAIQESRLTEAYDLLKKLAVNQYLVAADRQRAQKLMEQVKPRVAGPGQVPGPFPDLPVFGAGNVQELARGKLQQARLLLAKGHFDAAEQLALEADKLNATYSDKEDRPEKALRDIRKARQDPSALLVAARQALQDGDLDRAERLAKESDKARSTLMKAIPSFGGDTSSKVLKDVQAARTRPPATRLPAAMSSVEVSGGSADARLPVTGVLTSNPAPKNTTAARPPGPTLPPTASSQAKPVDVVTEPPLGPPSAADAEDPHALLKRGRDLLSAGQLDEAWRCAQKARLTGGRWGMFEDTPEKLEAEVEKARTKRDRAEAARMLAEGRKLLAAGDIPGASNAAYKAQILRGPASAWEWGDRPEKLLADIEAQQAKSQKPLPAAPPPTTVKPAAAPLPVVEVPALSGDPRLNRYQDTVMAIGKGQYTTKPLSPSGQEPAAPGKATLPSTATLGSSTIPVLPPMATARQPGSSVGLDETTTAMRIPEDGSSEPFRPVARPAELSARQTVLLLHKEKSSGELPPIKVINSKRVLLGCEGAGTESAGVDIWVTRDMQEWQRCSTIRQASGFIAEVKEEGLYGFSVLAHDDGAVPRAGTAPQIWVDVDLTRPVVKVSQVSMVVEAGKPILQIAWQANDKNLSPRPIAIYYADRTDLPWQLIASGLENTGSYQWRLPANLPGRFFLRVEATDLGGNIGAIQVPQALHIDRAEPSVNVLDVYPSK
jgi:hypothetical protein